LYNDLKIIAIIPARGHNDSIDMLNLKNLGNKPLITYTIDEARKSRYIDEIYVSTEDERIAEISQEHEAVIPFLRPAELVRTGVTTMDVVKHAVSHIGTGFDAVVTLLPNAPFRNSEIIDAAIEFMMENNYKEVIGIQKQEDWYLYKEKDEYISLNPRFGISNNKFMPIYRYGGGIFLHMMEALLSDGDTGDNCGHFLIHEHNARLIRSLYDLIIAERLINLHHSLVDSLIKAT